MVRGHIFLHVFTGFLLVIMLAFTANRLLNRHIHKLDNGRVIAHAHPYQKTSGDNPAPFHHHSDTEISFIHTSEIFVFTVLLLTLCIKLIMHEMRFEYRKVQYHDEAIQHFRNRAPPLFF